MLNQNTTVCFKKKSLSLTPYPIKKRNYRHCKRATYFLAKRQYHRPWRISLPCSVWERVEHLQYSPLTVPTILILLIWYGVQWDKTDNLGTAPSTLIAAKRCAVRVFSLISSARLNPSRDLHLRPIKVVISDRAES